MTLQQKVCRFITWIHSYFPTPQRYHKDCKHISKCRVRYGNNL